MRKLIALLLLVVMLPGCMTLRNRLTHVKKGMSVQEAHIEMGRPPDESVVWEGKTYERYSDRNWNCHLIYASEKLESGSCEVDEAGDPVTLAERMENERRNLLAAEMRKRSEAAEVAGTSKKLFDETHGKPTSEELRDGKLIYWYRDSNPPMYFEFKNDKLVSKYVDKETVRVREDAAQRQYDRNARAEENARLNRMMLWQSMQQQYRPAKTTCTSTKIGNMVQTNCN